MREVKYLVKGYRVCGYDMDKHKYVYEPFTELVENSVIARGYFEMMEFRWMNDMLTLIDSIEYICNEEVCNEL